MKKPKIAIVGASIAGGAAGILLDRAGMDVTIFEQRSKGELVDRGAGIALPKYLVRQLIELDIFDKDFPCIDVNERQFIHLDENTGNERLITSKPFLASSVHWAALYMNLAKRLPNDKTVYDVKITDFKPGKEAILTINGKETERFDAVIFADGYHSIGRQTLFPECAPKFSNYIAWRGTMIRVDEETNKHLLDKVPFYLFEKGHLLIYSIPMLNTHQPNKEYIVNWLMYEYIDPAHPMRRDHVAQDNLPPHMINEEYLAHLHTLARKHFSEFPRDVVLQTPKPFTQAIYDARVPTYVMDNAILMGDSSILARPHVGAGSTKALEDALSLCRHLQAEPDMQTALAAWGKERHAVADKLLTLCRDLGSLLVSDMPDWNQMDKQKMDELWAKIVKEHADWYQIKKD